MRESHVPNLETKINSIISPSTKNRGRFSYKKKQKLDDFAI